MPVDSAEFRRALGSFSSAVTVVTANDGGDRWGITVTSFCSLSLDPPLVLICIDRRARMHDPLRRASSFAVNFLAADQEHVSRRFASHQDDPFRDLPTTPGKLGAPVIEGCLAGVECTIVEMLPGGDHTIFVGQVEATWCGEGLPLLYFRGRYGHLA